MFFEYEDEDDDEDDSSDRAAAPPAPFFSGIRFIDSPRRAGLGCAEMDLISHMYMCEIRSIRTHRVVGTASETCGITSP
jgi:hypothetical protein